MSLFWIFLTIFPFSLSCFLYSSEGNQSFATLKVLIWDVDFMLFIKKHEKNIWPSLLSCPRHSYRITCFRKDVLDVCLSLIWIKHGKQERLDAPCAPTFLGWPARIFLPCMFCSSSTTCKLPILTFEI